MSKVWKPQPKDILSSWIDAIETEASEELTDWEIVFLQSCKNRLEYEGSLSERQEVTLERLYAKKTK